MTDDTNNANTGDPQAILEKYDKESCTRSGQKRAVVMTITILAASLSLYHLYTSYFGTPVTLIHRSLHLAAILALAFAN